MVNLVVSSKLLVSSAQAGRATGQKSRREVTRAGRRSGLNDNDEFKRY